MTEPATLTALAAPAPAPEDAGRYVLHFGDFRSGELWGTLPASAFTWTSELLAAGTTQVTIPASPQAAEMWEAVKAGPALVAVEWTRNFGRRILWASPVVARNLGTTDLTVGGSGLFGHLGKRLLIPNAAAGSIAAALGMTFTGDRGTIMARIVAQALSMPEGDLPVVLEAYRTGTRTGTYYGYDMAFVAQRLSELADNNPPTDFAFLPRFADGPDYTRIVWDMLTGTEVAPSLNSTADLPIVVDGTAPGQNTIRGLSWSESTSGMGTHAYAIGTSSKASTVIRGAVDTALTDEGGPRMDVTAENESNDGATVQGYADGLSARTKRPLRSIRVEVDAQFWWSQNARLGDSVHVTFNHPIAGSMDLTSRLLSESGDVTTDSVTLTLADTLAED